MGKTSSLSNSTVQRILHHSLRQAGVKNQQTRSSRGMRGPASRSSSATIASSSRRLPTATSGIRTPRECVSAFAFSSLYYRYSRGPGNPAPNVLLWASFFSLLFGATLRASSRRIATQFLVLLRGAERYERASTKRIGRTSTLEGSSRLGVPPYRFDQVLHR